MHTPASRSSHKGMGRFGPVAFLNSLFDRKAGLLVAVASALLCLPFVNSIWLLADEGIWLHAARRMLDGQILYRDFFEFHPPLGFLLVTGWMGVFGSSLLAARLLIILVIALTAWLAFSCCRILSGRPGIPGLLTLTWVATCQGEWTQVNHHWLTSLFSVLALRAMLPVGDKRMRPLAAGLAASAATLVTSHRGALIVLAGFASVTGRGWRAVGLYMAGGLALLVAILVFLWTQGTLMPALDQVVLFALNHYSDIQAVPFGAFGTPQTTLAVAAFPLAAGLLALAFWRQGASLLRERHFGTACYFALAGFLGCFPRPDAIHIAFCAVLVLPLLAQLLDIVLPAKPSLLFIGIVSLICLTPFYALLSSAIRVANVDPIKTLAGPVKIMRDDGTAELLDRLQELPAGDRVFFYPYDPVLPFLSGRRHPVTLDLFVPQYTTASQYHDSCLQVMRNAEWVVFDSEISQPSFYRVIFPSMSNPSPPEKTSFEAALKKGFAIEHQYGGFQVLRRRTASADTSRWCAQVKGD